MTLHAEFTPAPGAFPAAANAILPLHGPSLAMTGHNRYGGVVTARGTTKTGRNWRRDTTGLEDDFHYFDVMDVRFSPGVLDDFTDLDSLTLKTFGYFEAGSIEELSVAYETPKALGAPEILLAGLLACGLDDCAVEGFGDFRYYLEYAGPRNDTQNVKISTFPLDVASP